MSSVKENRELFNSQYSDILSDGTLRVLYEGRKMTIFVVGEQVFAVVPFTDTLPAEDAYIFLIINDAEAKELVKDEEFFTRILANRQQQNRVPILTQETKEKLQKINQNRFTEEVFLIPPEMEEEILSARIPGASNNDWGDAAAELRHHIMANDFSFAIKNSSVNENMTNVEENRAFFNTQYSELLSDGTLRVLYEGSKMSIFVVAEQAFAAVPFTDTLPSEDAYIFLYLTMAQAKKLIKDEEYFKTLLANKKITDEVAILCRETQNILTELNKKRRGEKDYPLAPEIEAEILSAKTPSSPKKLLNSFIRWLNK